MLEDVVGLAEDGAGAARIGEREVRLGHLEQRLDRHDWEGIAEQRSQTGGHGDELSALRSVTPMQRHSCRPGVHEGTRPVLVELAVTDDRQRLLGERRGRGPVVALDRHDAPLGEEDGE